MPRILSWIAGGGLFFGTIIAPSSFKKSFCAICK
jgi:hypothetical protein